MGRDRAFAAEAGGRTIAKLRERMMHKEQRRVLRVIKKSKQVLFRKCSGVKGL
jgi:hypothetical protein